MSTVEQIEAAFAAIAPSSQQRSASDINASRSAESWHKISRALAIKYRYESKGIRPNDDLKQDLLAAFVIRCNADPNALDDDRYKLTIWRTAKDVAQRQQRIKAHKPLREEGEQTYSMLKRDCGLIPLHSHHRTAGQQYTWERIVLVANRIAEDPELDFFVFPATSTDYA